MIKQFTRGVKKIKFFNSKGTFKWSQDKNLSEV